MACMDRIGYARTSTSDQTTSQQLMALRESGCTRVFEDAGVSGTLRQRPGLTECLAYLRKGDVLTVYSISRIGRNLRDLIEIVEQLGEREIMFESISEPHLNIGDRPSDRLTFNIFAALAQFERDLLSERTTLALRQRREAGVVLGRPRALDNEQVATARVLLAAGRKPAEVARTLGCARSTLYSYLGDQT